MMKNKKAGSHRYAPTDELRESAKIDMCLCNPAIKLPVAAPTAAHCICSIRQILYINQELTFLGENR